MKLSKAIEIFDRVFSQYVRLRDADLNGNITCIYCETKVFWKEAQNAHYIDRGHNSTRFDELNCNSAHGLCNQENNLEAYRKNLIKKIGECKVENLEQMKYQTRKFSVAEVLSLIEHYRKKVKDLKQYKLIKV